MTFRLTSLLVATIAALSLATVQAQTPHNLILFVPAGLRASSVTPEHGPAMAAVRDKGVNFANSHSVPDLHHGQCVRHADRAFPR